MDTLVKSITDVWTAMSAWIVDSIESLLPVFYNATDGSLTILGLMCVISVGIGLFLLLCNVVTSFFGFRQ